jgi:signal peptidase II
VDQGSWAWDHLRHPDSGRPLSRIINDGLFHLEFAFNTGSAFGFLRDAEWSRYFFIAITVAALVYMGRLAWTLPTRWPAPAFVAIGLIASGALGNLHDRFVRIIDGNYGVVDFIVVFYWPGKRWPAFNIADAALVAGVLLFMIYLRRHGDRPAKARHGLTWPDGRLSRLCPLRALATLPMSDRAASQRTRPSSSPPRSPPSPLLTADLATKAWAWDHLRELRPASPSSRHWFYFDFSFNTGSAFGFLRGTPFARPLFIVITLATVVYMAMLVRKLPTQRLYGFVAIGCILGGALGNLHDRLLRQIDVKRRSRPTASSTSSRSSTCPGQPSWPNFNIADVALVIGVALLIPFLICSTPIRPRPTKPRRPDPTATTRRAPADLHRNAPRLRLDVLL